MSIIGWMFLPTTVIVDYKFSHLVLPGALGTDSCETLGTAVVFLYVKI